VAEDASPKPEPKLETIDSVEPAESVVIEPDLTPVEESTESVSSERTDRSHEPVTDESDRMFASDEELREAGIDPSVLLTDETEVQDKSEEQAADQEPEIFEPEAIEQPESDEESGDADDIQIVEPAEIEDSYDESDAPTDELPEDNQPEPSTEPKHNESIR